MDNNENLDPEYDGAGTEPPHAFEARDTHTPIPFTGELRLEGVQIVGDRAKLFAALARAQKNFGPIVKNREVEVKPREGRPYTFRYATHDQVLSQVQPALNDQGLALVSLPVTSKSGKDILHTLLTHESGAALAVTYLLGEFDNPQKYGSALTYGRRYADTAITGCSSEHDDDGNAASGSEVVASKETRDIQAPNAPANDAVKTMLTLEFERLGIDKGPRKSVICQEVTGKKPNDLLNSDANKLLAHLRAMGTEGEKK